MSNHIVEEIKKKVFRGIDKFNMISEGDKVIVAVSGGKDSLALLDMLHKISKYSKYSYEIVAVYVVPGNPLIKDYSIELEEIFKNMGVNYIIKPVKIPEGSKLHQGIEDLTTCQWCTYTRRITLFKLAEEIKATKIAYGHHMDDIVDTLFMNIQIGRYLKIMPPKNNMKKGDLSIIRPLCFVREDEIIKYCHAAELRPLRACCPVLLKSSRNHIRLAIDNLEKELPNFVENMFKAYIDKLGSEENG